MSLRLSSSTGRVDIHWEIEYTSAHVDREARQVEILTSPKLAIAICSRYVLFNLTRATTYGTGRSHRSFIERVTGSRIRATIKSL
ncbi:hypothetical protein Tco_0018657 [Tanacetum coccineum]